MLTTLNDAKSVTPTDVETIVRKVCVSYAHLRRSYLTEIVAIDNALDQGDVGKALVKLLRVYGLPTKFCTRIGYNATGLPEAAIAAMELRTIGKNPVPISGTLLFVGNKQAVLSMSRYRLLHLIGHELAHARMFTDEHEMCTSEFATDVLALLVTGHSEGYRKYMITHEGIYGYIRRDLHGLVFAALDTYANRFYVR